MSLELNDPNVQKFRDAAKTLEDASQVRDHFVREVTAAQERATAAASEHYRARTAYDRALAQMLTAYQRAFPFGYVPE